MESEKHPNQYYARRRSGKNVVCQIRAFAKAVTQALADRANVSAFVVAVAGTGPGILRWRRSCGWSVPSIVRSETDSLATPTPSISPESSGDSPTGTSSPSETGSRSRQESDDVSFAPVDVIQVSAWRQISPGFVARDPNTNYYAFEFDDEWILAARAWLALHLPPTQRLCLPQLSRDTYYGLPAVADALPDRFGNALVAAWLADQGVEEPISRPSIDWRTRVIAPMGALTFAAHRPTAGRRHGRRGPAGGGGARGDPRWPAPGVHDALRQLHQRRLHRAEARRGQGRGGLQPGDPRDEGPASSMRPRDSSNG